MTIPYVQRDFYFIGYGPIPNPIGIWLSDTPGLPTPAGPMVNPYFPLVFPTWMPRKLFIVDLCIAYEVTGNGIIGQGIETTAWVDVKGTDYNTGNPHGAENSDFMRDIMLSEDYNETHNFQVIRNLFNTPVLCNRDAGDKLAIKCSGSIGIDWIAIVLGISVPNSIQPDVMGPGY